MNKEESTQIREARDTLTVLHEISTILDCGLDRETLSTCLALTENGVNPEALAAVVKELKREASNISTASSRPNSIIDLSEGNLNSSSANSKIFLYQGDITTLEVESIVNAANNSLLGGGGVDGAIHRAAGSKLKNECRKLNGCETGDAKITLGYNLPAKHVIHTVGPVGTNPTKLKSCYQNSLNLMEKNNLRTIAFPCISTGIYGYPNSLAAHVALKTIREWVELNDDKIDKIILCLFMPIDIKIYGEIMCQYFPPEDSINQSEVTKTETDFDTKIESARENDGSVSEVENYNLPKIPINDLNVSEQFISQAEEAGIQKKIYDLF
ncbi:hypothetical protein HK096_001660 [Nowakowskiella sp. JEL0078]|nr:hypothetical protein HK096_001660 [Nowakowskiella sp. JEL0078]